MTVQYTYPFYFCATLTHAPLTASTYVHTHHSQKISLIHSRRHTPRAHRFEHVFVSTSATSTHPRASSNSLSLVSPTSSLSVQLGRGAATTTRRRRNASLPFPAKHPLERQHATHRRPKRRRRVATRLVPETLVPRRRHLNGHAHKRRLPPQPNRRGTTNLPTTTGSVLLFHPRTGFGLAHGDDHFGSGMWFGRGLHGSAAKGASGVGVEPHVNAVGMEFMVALWQYPTRFTRFELRQADGALRRVFRVGLGVVGEDGERGDDGGVEAACGSGDGGGVVGVEDELGAAAEVTAASTDEVPAGVEVEKEHQKDDEEEEDDGGEHDLAAEAVTLCIEVFGNGIILELAASGVIVFHL